MRIFLKTTPYLFLVTTPLFAATQLYLEDNELPCLSEECVFTYCAGPEETAAALSVNPRTCKGDFTVTFAGFYWNAHQDGMEYALKNNELGAVSDPDNEELNNLIEAEYLTPNFSWDFGFKLGIGYNSACDGWDVGALWTSYRERGSTYNEAGEDDNSSLLPLWSSFQYPFPENAPILFATDIKTHWKLDLDQIDLELGRASWNSYQFILRPHVGLRLCQIKEALDIEYEGGSWNSEDAETQHIDWIQLTSRYRGIGIRSGLDLVWNLSCGFGLFGQTALSILYGRFQLDHLEYLREISSSERERLLDTEERLYASRAVFDLNLGIQWSALFCECRYGFTMSLAWEQHLFFHQNQFWRIYRIGGINDSTMLPFNDSGQNNFEQRRGTLSTEGWILMAHFEF